MVVMGLIEVELGDIKKVEKEFADLLKQRLKTDVTMKGGKLLLDQTGGHVSPKDEVTSETCTPSHGSRRRM